VGDRPEIVAKLEDKVQELLRDHRMTTQTTGINESDRSPLTGYENISKNPNISMGVRYLALHCVANKQGLYHDSHDQPQMLGVMSQEMGKVPLATAVQDIQQLKTYYPSVYDLDRPFFDRAESNALELMTRLTVDQQDKTVAEAKGVPLQPLPISAPVPQTPPTPQPAPEVPKEPEPASAVSQIYNSSSPTATAIPVANQSLNQSNNKAILIIGGGAITGAIIFSAFMLAQQPNQQNILTTVRNSSPTSMTSGNNISTPIIANSSTLSSPSASNNSSSSVASSSNRISQDEATKVIQQWLQAKNSLFGPPYNQQLGMSLTTGKALSDNIRGPSTDGEAESSLEWLRNRGKYWRYGSQVIESVKNFVSDDQKAIITVNVYEQRVLYNQSGRAEKNISQSSLTKYSLEKSGGRLKISDFK
jgi:ARC6-like, IMS domain